MLFDSSLDIPRDHNANRSRIHWAHVSVSVLVSATQTCFGRFRCGHHNNRRSSRGEFVPDGPTSWGSQHVRRLIIFRRNAPHQNLCQSIRSRTSEIQLWISKNLMSWRQHNVKNDLRIYERHLSSHLWFGARSYNAFRHCVSIGIDCTPCSRIEDTGVSKKDWRQQAHNSTRSNWLYQSARSCFHIILYKNHICTDWQSGYQRWSKAKTVVRLGFATFHGRRTEGE
jgi:hypothetical protein